MAPFANQNDKSLSFIQPFLTKPTCLQSINVFYKQNKKYPNYSTENEYWRKWKMMTRARPRFWEPPKNNSRMAFCLELRCWCSCLQATRRNILGSTILTWLLPRQNHLAIQSFSCTTSLPRFVLPLPSPVSNK